MTETNYAKTNILIYESMQWMATICAAAPSALANQLPLPTIVKRGWSL